MTALRFLIVDDEALMRGMLKALLRRLRPRAEFVEASNAHDANFAFDAESFNAVFLDMELPGGPGGLYATSTLARKAPKVPIILATAVGREDTRVKAAILQGAHYLQKPIQLDALQRLLGEIEL